MLTYWFGLVIVNLKKKAVWTFMVYGGNQTYQ